MAVDGQASMQRRQPVHARRSMATPLSVPWSACSGQASTQLRQPMHREAVQCTWGLAEMLSGLWHHTHRKGQPLKKTVLLMPGPSSVDIRCILRMSPCGCSGSFPVMSQYLFPPNDGFRLGARYCREKPERHGRPAGTSKRGGLSPGR